MNFDNLRCILQECDLTAECMFTGILVLKKFLLSILKYLKADNTELEGNDDDDDLDPGLFKYGFLQVQNWLIEWLPPAMHNAVTYPV